MAGVHGWQAFIDWRRNPLSLAVIGIRLYHSCSWFLAREVDCVIPNYRFHYRRSVECATVRPGSGDEHLRLAEMEAADHC